ncbi:baculoviral IAP repeat-containing protein 7 [Perognathus longimembris pacificus]|uniref:baculoviral IAP repeat-containing protein 7 n=1 Tax=Perognathus longimembris pacificus TaxID=214514 RepID=UPI0020196394|nr:baculoviral IAP repeat-containing protein 7 [Perognathus longimembris pacificus]
MGPKGRAECQCCGPVRSPGAASPRQESQGPHHLCSQHCTGPRSQDCVDGQILGQLRPVTEEEEEEEERTRAASPREPAFPEMSSEELRLASFCDWPPTAGVQPELLAAAGFFHTGQQDKVRCFFCDGGLQSWERGDDPWTEHAKWFPRCRFLLWSKGRGFIHSVQEACAPVLSSWDRWEDPEATAPVAPSGPVQRDPELLVPRGQIQPECVREPAETREPGVRDAEEQLRRLQEERLCKVCLDRAVSVVFVPCGHLACADCAPSLQQCPLCRAPVSSCVRTFLS